MDKSSILRLKEKFGQNFDIEKLIVQDTPFWEGLLQYGPDLENVKDKNIIDIGAYFGHSALIWSAMGARHVLAIEPDPMKFFRMKSNVAGSNNITPVRGFVANGKENPYCNYPIEADSRSLAEWSSFFPYDDNLVLSMKIFGAEYDVLLGAGNQLLRFEAIRVETHQVSDQKYKIQARTVAFLKEYLNFLGFDHEVKKFQFWAEWRKGVLHHITLENCEGILFKRRNTSRTQSNPVSIQVTPEPKPVQESSKPLAIEAFAVCWNEEKMLPYYLRHYSRFCRKITIYDNKSTDKSVEIMKKYNVDVVEYESDDQMNEKKLIEIKSTCWKGSTADWVIVGDIDELIFSENLLADLKTAKDLGYTVIETDFFDMVSDVFPTHDGNLYDVVKEGVYVKEYRKALAFRPDCIKEINYEVGGHSCNPSGEVKFLHRSKIITLHCRYLSLEYLLSRYQAYNSRATDESKIKGWGLQYQAGIDKIKSVFQYMWDNKIKVID